MKNKFVKDKGPAVKKSEEIPQEGPDSNEKFKEAFDNELVKINSLIADRDPYEYSPSEVLFLIDRTAYLEELESYENSEAQEEHNKTIEHLFSTGQNSIFEELKDVISRKRVAPFVGAGISKSFGFPLWDEALKSINDELNKVDGVEALIASYDYLAAAEILYRRDKTIFNNYIRTKFPIGEEKKRELLKWGVPRWLPKMISGCVITTNYDKILEEIFEADGKPFQGFMKGVNQDKFASKLIKNDRCILKLHGDYEYEESYVFSQSQYTNAYCKEGTNELDFTKPLPKTLRQIYISHSLLFLGCSLEQDKTLDLFKSVKEENQFDVPEHFAILEDKRPDDPQWRTNTRSRLLKLNIRPIWYPQGEHNMVEQMISLAIDLIDKKVIFKRKKT